jgi:hypothetical protein
MMMIKNTKKIKRTTDEIIKVLKRYRGFEWDFALKKDSKIDLDLLTVQLESKKHIAVNTVEKIKIILNQRIYKYNKKKIVSIDVGLLISIDDDEYKYSFEKKDYDYNRFYDQIGRILIYALQTA